MRSISIILILFAFIDISAADEASLRQAASEAIAAGDIDSATQSLQELLETAPDDGATHYQLASLIMDNGGDLALATQHFERAKQLEFQPMGVAYRLSRIYARLGQTDAALEQIEAMAAGGFGLINLLDSEPDYDDIRANPRFVAAEETIRSTRFPCQTDQRHHSFDFWLGEWEVTQSGQFAGTNDIQAILGHCVIFEQWESATGSLGKSFNYYDPAFDHWRQIWISDSGSIIEFTGKARDGGIFYTAETVNPADGSRTHHKFEFTQRADGGVRQFWQTSTDDAKTWSTIWDGQYDRK